MPFYGAIQTPIFMPAIRDILSITQANPAVVTTTFDGSTAGDNGYLTGLIVSLNIPLNFGMQALNQQVFPITVLSSSTFSIPLDTTGLDPFSIPSLQPGFNYTPAQVTPVGEDTAQLNQSFRNTLTPLY